MDFETYGPLVGKGGMIVFHDSIATFELVNQLNQKAAGFEFKCGCR